MKDNDELATENAMKAMNGARQLVAFVLAGNLAQFTDDGTGIVDYDKVKEGAFEQLDLALVAMKEDVNICLKKFRETHTPAKMRELMKEAKE